MRLVRAGVVARKSQTAGGRAMRRWTFTTMLAGLACAIAVSGPLLAQAQAPQGGSRKRIGPALYGAFLSSSQFWLLFSLLLFLRRLWTFVTIKGETGHRSAAPGRDTALYPVASCEAHHDAIIRIVGEAPQWRSHSKARRLNAMAGLGLPPPRIVIGSPPSQRRGGDDEFRL